MKYSNIAAPVLIEEGRATFLPHNLSPYDIVCEALCENNVINIVAGTGTGKSYLTSTSLSVAKQECSLLQSKNVVYCSNNLHTPV